MYRVTMLFVLAGIVVFSGLCDAEFAEYFVKCSNQTNTTTLRPSKDGVAGRYELEWCTDVTADDDKWAIEVGFNQNRLSTCGYRGKHSAVIVDLNKQLPNCSYVCLTFTPLDLMFNACYTVHNWFPRRGSLKSISNHNISSGYTLQEFHDAKFYGAPIFYEEEVSLHFNTNLIPVPYYDVYLKKKNASDAEHDEWDRVVTERCRLSSWYEIVCRLPLPEGAYSASAQFSAPWAQGVFNEKKSFYVDFRVERPRTVAVDSSIGASAALRWACAALGALCGAALLLLLALRCRRAAAQRKHVLRDWLNRVESNKPAASEAPAPAPAGPILLVYARECAQAEPVVDALTKLLETVAPGQVYDINSTSTVALAAAAGGEWVRGVMARADTRVVLLQTPALHALHAPRLAPGAPLPRLEQPLLSHRAVYKAPAAGDALAQFALRLLAGALGSPGAPLPYRKYYLAKLEGLDTETLPYTVPFRRYALPAHARTLLLDLAPAPAPAPAPPRLLDALAAAVADFRDHVRANPDYLADELLLL